MIRHPLRGLRGLLQMAWPEPCPDLERFPQLACLGALHAAASAAALATIAAHPDVDEHERLFFASQGLLACIETLLIAMERYQIELLDTHGERPLPFKPIPKCTSLSSRRRLTPDQAAFVFDLLQDIANAVWDAGHQEHDEPDLRAEPLREATMTDLPF